MDGRPPEHYRPRTRRVSSHTKSHARRLFWRLRHTVIGLPRQHAVDMARQQVIDRERHFDDRWTALETEIRDRSRLQPHSWVYQQMGIWLREEMIRIIREVHPEVTPRPEGYLRIVARPACGWDEMRSPPSTVTRPPANGRGSPVRRAGRAKRHWRHCC